MVFGLKRKVKGEAVDVSPESQIEELRSQGVREYMLMAPFDERTCPVCAQLDHKVFPLDEARIGENFPPMHPGCRCKAVAAPSEEYLRKHPTREIIDRSSGKWFNVPRNFTYLQWYDRFGPGRTDGVEYIPKFPKDTE